jgi:hypothetical protein
MDTERPTDRTDKWYSRSVLHYFFLYWGHESVAYHRTERSRQWNLLLNEDVILAKQLQEHFAIMKAMFSARLLQTLAASEALQNRVPVCVKIITGFVDTETTL